MSTSPMHGAYQPEIGGDAGSALGHLLSIVYGGLPPAPDATTGELLHQSRLPLGGDGATLESWRVRCGSAGQVQFAMQLALPPQAQTGAVPVLVCGDACWGYLGDAVKAKVLGAGLALAWYNRTEVAEDLPGGGTQRQATLYRWFPGRPFGALAAWAWSLHRAIDVLAAMPAIDSSRVGVVGHSRGGKAALIAGATDSRIWLTAANNAGAGGSASHKVRGPGSETLGDLWRAFPHWLGPAIGACADDPQSLPFDQDELLAAIAPRRLIITQAEDDAWANPLGTRHAVALAEQAYARSGRPDALRLVMRKGGHPHLAEDWDAVLAFAIQR